jgi:hypothetical protein
VSRFRIGRKSSLGVVPQPIPRLISSDFSVRASSNTSRRDSSAPGVSWRWGGAFSSFSLKNEGGERRLRRIVSRGTSKKAPACRVTGRRAFRRSTVAIFDEATGLRRWTGGPHPHVIQAALALPFIRSSRSHSRQPPHRVRPVTSRPGTGLRIPPAGATPCSAN